MSRYRKYIFAFVFSFVLQWMPNVVSAQIMNEITILDEDPGINVDIPDYQQDCDAALDAAQWKVNTGNVLMWTGGGLAVAGITLYGLDVAALDNTWKGISGLAAAGTGILTLGTGIILHCVGKRQLNQIKCNNITLALLPSDNGLGLKIRF